ADSNGLHVTHCVTSDGVQSTVQTPEGGEPATRAQGDDFRTFLVDFVAALPQGEISNYLSQ
ncbi:MAG: hypothetical protein DMG39_18125, partial [Acidobacteria bacterium]